MSDAPASPDDDLPAIIDVEASGFGRGSYPIEVGLVTAEGEAFCTLIRPQPEWQHWDAAAEQVHGVARPLLDQHGRSAREVAQQLNERLHGRVVYSDGWANDYSWLGALFDAVDSFPAFRLKDLRELLSEAEKAIWHATRDEVQQRLQLRRHRASSDARIIQETLRTVRHRCRDQAAA